MGTQIVLDLYHRIQRCFFPTMNMMNFVGILKMIEMLKLSKTSHDNLEIKNEKKNNSTCKHNKIWVETNSYKIYFNHALSTTIKSYNTVNTLLEMANFYNCTE